MKPILFLYSTCDGQTKKILQYIKDEMQTRNVELRAIDAKEVIDAAQYHSILIGASIRYGKFRPALYEFIKQNQSVLNQLPCGFIGVCLTARKEGKDIPENNVYMRKFNQCITWQPSMQAVFAGALLYSKYNWWQTKIIKLIMKITGGSTDTSQDIELTDWVKVERFINKYKILISE